MKRPLLASMAAVLVSSALIVSPAAAVETSTSEPVLAPSTQPSYKSGGELSTMGAGAGSNAYWCNFWGWFC
ncbi:MAG: hypothetical protein QJR09_01060 [Micrococcus sp.]|nr:hypothetical protein [Micrococcus sp.]